MHKCTVLSFAGQQQQFHFAFGQRPFHFPADPLGFRMPPIGNCQSEFLSILLRIFCFEILFICLWVFLQTFMKPQTFFLIQRLEFFLFQTFTSQNKIISSEGNVQQCGKSYNNWLIFRTWEIFWV
jgi:hypothetical protein